MSSRYALTLRIARPVWERVTAYHLAPGKRREALSYLWARCERIPGGYAVLVPSDSPYFAFGQDCYARQAAGNVRLLPEVLNGMLVEFARSDYNCLINIHDHWFANAGLFSSIDDEDDVRFQSYINSRFEPMLKAHPEFGPARDIHNVSIVLGQHSLSARLMRNAAPALPACKTVILDENWRTVPCATQTPPGVPSSADWHSRHAAFLSSGVQDALAQIRIAIVGCGGLGSIVAESMVRSGARHLALIDDDHLEASNLNRWQGAVPADVGRSKAKLLSHRLAAMAEGCVARPIHRNLEHPMATAALAGADLIIGCLDNDAARYRLAHVSLQFLVPYFDAGVAITAGPPVDFQGRFFAMIPEITGCIDCKGFVLTNREAIVEAYANTAILAEQRAAGYIVDAPGMAAPSAYVLNQRTAALAVTEVLNFLAGWRPLATVVTESWSAGSFKRLDRALFPEYPVAVCPLCSLRTGRGSTLPLPRRSSGAGLHNWEILP